MKSAGARTRAPLRGAAFAAVFFFSAAAAQSGAPCGAAAPARLTAQVLALRPHDVVLVRHAAAAGMPAMDMIFRVAPATWRRLRPGAVVDAGVDMRTQPWTLRGVRDARDARGVRAAGPAARSPAAFVPPLREGDALPDYALIDQRGRPLTLHGLGGAGALIVSFIYTRCPDPRMCPLVSSKFGRLQRAIGRERIHLLEVTLDPAYDRPPVLARYAAQFGADPTRWTIATGEPAQIAQLSSRAGIALGPASGGSLHAEALLLVDPAGRVARILDGNDWTVEQALSEARATLGARPNGVVRLTLWLAAGVAAACGGGRAGLSTGAAIVIFLALLAASAILIKRVFRSLFV